MQGSSTAKTLLVAASICAGILTILASSCSTRPTDLRTLVPLESLVYLETNDLAAALQPIIESKPFADAAASKPDLSPLRGVQLAVAILGLQATEERLTDESSVGSVKPIFVAVADTHSWNSAAVAFAENRLGGFVAGIYDSEPKLELSEKFGGRYFAWTAEDGRRAFALVIDSIIYFANDETAIEKCLAVRRGESDSIIRSDKVRPAEAATLARGYVSADGVAQIANVVGLKYAAEASDDGEVRAAIASVLPQLIRNSIIDITWTSTRSGDGVEDRYTITMPPDTANVLAETLAPGPDIDPSLADHILPDPASVTFYNFKDPQVAWRSVLLTAQKSSGTIGARILAELSSAVFEPYGVADPERFLRGVGPSIITQRWDGSDSEPIAIAAVRDAAEAAGSFSKATPLLQPGNSPNGDKIFHAEDDSFAYGLLADGKLICGDRSRLFDSISRPEKDTELKARELYAQAFGSKSPVVTFGRDNETAAAVADMLSAKRSENVSAISTYRTETRFSRAGIDRRTVSSLGLIGLIIAQLSEQ